MILLQKDTAIFTFFVALPHHTTFRAIAQKSAPLPIGRGAPSYICFKSRQLSPGASSWGPHLTQLHNPIYSYLTLLYQGYPNLPITYPYTPVHTPCSDRCKIGVCGVRCILAAFWGRLASECSVREMPFQRAVTHLPRCGTLRKNSYQVPETHLFSVLS